MKKDHTMKPLAGKRVGTEFYVQTSALEGGRSSATPLELARYLKAKALVPKGTVYDIVDIGRTRVRFLRMSSVMEPHPFVVQSVVVDTTTGKVTAGKLNRQIYHRMDLIVDPALPLHNYHVRIREYEETIGALGPFKVGGKTPSGHYHTWRKQLASKRLNYGLMILVQEWLKAAPHVTTDEIAKKLFDIEPLPEGAHAVCMPNMEKAIRSGRQCTKSKMTVVSKLLASNYLCTHKKKILDFGAGFDAVQTKFLREKGLDVTAWDLPENRVKGLHDPKALKRKYDLIMCSNVLNVQPDLNHVINVAKQVHKLLAPYSYAFFNYPSGPHYAGLSSASTGEALTSVFESVIRVPKEVVGNNVVWDCCNVPMMERKHE